MGIMVSKKSPHSSSVSAINDARHPSIQRSESDEMVGHFKSIFITICVLSSFGLASQIVVVTEEKCSRNP